MNTLIRIENLNFSYPGAKVLNNLNLNIREGELSIIVGENGSGKSTLLKLILGELKKDSGKIELFGKNIEEFRDFRKIGYVPQVQVMNDTGFPLSCLEMVVSALYRDYGFLKIPDKKHLKLSKKTLIDLGLENYINTPVSELSGGLKQRTMIARALINSPELVILDEPTAGIDKESKDNFMEIIVEMIKDKSKTFVIVSHEPDYLKSKLCSASIYRVEEGRILNA